MFQQILELLLRDDLAQSRNRVALYRWRIDYDAYGEARHRYAGDLDGDGDVDVTDQTLFPSGSPGIGASGYMADFDLTFDGANDFSDVTAWLVKANAHGTALPDGWVGDPSDSSGPDNSIGYAGYRFNAEAENYEVRNRVYLPVLGRWAQRDPMGYIDGASLYGYVKQSPVMHSDWQGLAAAAPVPSPSPAPSPFPRPGPKPPPYKIPRGAGNAGAAAMIYIVADTAYKAGKWLSPRIIPPPADTTPPDVAGPGQQRQPRNNPDQDCDDENSPECEAAKEKKRKACGDKNRGYVPRPWSPGGLPRTGGPQSGMRGQYCDAVRNRIRNAERCLAARRGVEKACGFDPKDPVHAAVKSSIEGSLRVLRQRWSRYCGNR